MMDRWKQPSQRTTFAPALRRIGANALPPILMISPEAFAVVGALSLTLASVNLTGPLGVLMFIAGFGLTFVRRPIFNLVELLHFSPLLLLPLLAMLSTIWSSAPNGSMHAGLELLLTFAAAIVLCRNMRPERLVLSLFVGSLIIASTLLNAIPGSLINKYPLNTWWGSKNQVGFVGYTLFAVSLGVIFDSKQPRLARFVAVGASGYALLIGFLAQSGGTTSSVALTLIALPPLAFLGWLKPLPRIALVALTLVVALVASFFLNDIAAAITDFRVNVLNKDATLTGRTYLWDFAARLSAGRPMLGYGYNAFWRQGNIDAEGLWRWGGIAGRAGFNFHNAFVGIRVDLGLVGVTILAVTCVVVTLSGLARQIATPSTSMACLLTISLVSYFRAYVEEGLISPFSSVTFVWLATMLYAVPLRQRTGAASPVTDSIRDAAVPLPPRTERWKAVPPRRGLVGKRGTVA